ncbi:MAG TPA: hypothetical protein VGR48_14190 [Terriglobales bacterium]|nr:hypothetical protein [Terriglobales bacterium]
MGIQVHAHTQIAFLISGFGRGATGAEARIIWDGIRMAKALRFHDTANTSLLGCSGQAPVDSLAVLGSGQAREGAGRPLLGTATYTS